MDGARIKVKIGDNEFEAEGPVETIQEQFNVFKELLSSHPVQSRVFSFSLGSGEIPKAWGSLARTQDTS